MSDSFVQKHIAKAKAEKKASRKFLQNLKRLPEKKVDRLFHENHDAVFEKLDCLDCANCCKTTSPIFKDRDIDRIAKHLRIKPSKLVETYLRLDEDHDYVLQKSPCSFLNDDNTCSIYEVRPNACREYPHTDRKKMHQLLDLTYRNTMVCPAVEQIVEKIRIDLQSSKSS